MKYKLWYLLFGVFFFVLIVVVVLYIIFLNPSESKLNKQKSKNIYNPELEKKENQKINISSEFDYCKKKADLVNCLLHYNTKEKNIKGNFTLNTDNLTKRLDKISDSINSIKKYKENFEENIVKNIQEQYINYNPSYLTEKISCETDFCKRITKNIKKGLVKEMIALGRINKKSLCDRIPEKGVAKYCKNYFE